MDDTTVRSGEKESENQLRLRLASASFSGWLTVAESTQERFTHSWDPGQSSFVSQDRRSWGRGHAEGGTLPGREGWRPLMDALISTTRGSAAEPALAMRSRFTSKAVTK